MIKLFFGLPGCGKSSFVAWSIVNELLLMDSGKSRYERIYTNCPVNIPDPRVFYLQYSDMIRYDLGSGSLCKIDEGQMEFSDRGFKSFSKADMLFWTQHRRFGYDIEIFTQQWDGIDRKIRILVNEVYYIRKGVLLKSFSHIYPVGYGIYIPRSKDTESKNYGEILQGYFRWNIFQRLFHTRFYRPVIYGLYDSFCRPPYAPIPSMLKNVAQRITLPSEPFPITLRDKFSSLVKKIKKKVGSHGTDK